MKKKYRVEKSELERLKRQVEDYIDFPLTGPDAYRKLAETLQRKGCSYVSDTTLKRIWGYISDTGCDYHPNAYTLTSLCNLLGYKDMDAFSANDTPLQSRDYAGEYVESRFIPENAVIELKWKPGRRCKLLHVKATLFKVISVANSSCLREDDMVECGCFTQNAPAYFTRVFRQNSLPVTYVAGSASGITYSIRTPENDA